MGKIFLIGGGEIAPLETLKLDRKAVKLTGKKKPKALFIPTASGEPQGYVDVFNKVYGKKLGCKIDVLYCLKGKPSKKKLRKQILSADLIYVGGGNTLKMMNRWRFLGVDKMLKEAYRKGIVLTGLSAGGMCWFESGHSDSRSFKDSKDWKYIKVSGLGLLKGIHCPHFDSATKGKKRKTCFKEFMKKYSSIGIAIDNNCAIEFIDGKYKLLRSVKTANAYRVFRVKGKVQLELIPEKGLVKDLYVK
jgi:dipeptidase E